MRVPRGWEGARLHWWWECSSGGKQRAPADTPVLAVAGREGERQPGVGIHLQTLLAITDPLQTLPAVLVAKGGRGGEHGLPTGTADVHLPPLHIANDLRALPLWWLKQEQNPQNSINVHLPLFGLLGLYKCGEVTFATYTDSSTAAPRARGI